MGRGNPLWHCYYARNSCCSVHFFILIFREYMLMNTEKRLGFIGIVIDSKDCIDEVNRILSKYGNLIRGRIGIPNHNDSTAVIGLITEGSNDDIGALTGKLGNLPGIIVKSALVPSKSNKEKKE